MSPKSCLCSPLVEDPAADRLKLLLDSVLDHAILVLDSEGQVVSWNLGAQRIQGYAAKEILGRHFSVFYPPEAVAAGLPARELEQAKEHGRVEEEGWRLRKDGSRFWANVVVTALYDVEGHLCGFGKVTRDFTLRRQTEQRKEIAFLQEALLARDEFLSVASHELKTPLTPLQLKLTALLHQLENRSEPLRRKKLERDLQFARRQVRKLAGLIEELLEVSHVVQGRLAIERRLMDAASLCKEIAAAHAAEAERAGCTLRLSLPARAMGEWDPSRLGQVLSSLLDNAIKYGPGHPIDVRMEDRGSHLLLTVEDRGIGIAEQDLPRIFGRFERAVSQRNYGGLGLGLFIARQVVEAMGGEISVHSRPGEGSTFQVALPRAHGLSQTAEPNA